MHKKTTAKKRFKVLLLYALLLSAIVFSCTKLDVSAPTQLHDVNFAQKFFQTKKPVQPVVQKVIDLLKVENQRNSFVNYLPQNYGLPIWDKLKIVKEPNLLKKGDSLDFGGNIYIPLTITDNAISGILLAKPVADTFNITFYSKDYLYSICHTDNVDTTKVQNLLAIFFTLENYCYGTTKFYNIPPTFFSKVTKKDTVGNKIIEIKDETNQDPNSLILVSCVTFYHCVNEPPCNNWYCDQCILCQTTYCSSEETPLPEGTPIPGGGTSGGGSGGSGCSGCPPPPPPSNCNNPFYLIDPCAPPPPPPPPPPQVYDTILDPCLFADSLENNLNFKIMLQDLRDHSNNPNDTTEHGWVYNHQPNGGLLVDPITGIAGEKYLDISFVGLADGVAHNHYNNSLSIFSPDDLWSICQVFKDKNMNDSAKFTFPLVTSCPTQYMLMIENITKFRAFVNVFMSGDLNIYSRLYTEKYLILETNTNADNENKFLRLLKNWAGGSGLKLFRGNANFTEWTPIGLDANNNTVTNPCN